MAGVVRGEGVMAVVWPVNHGGRMVLFWGDL